MATHDLTTHPSIANAPPLTPAGTSRRSLFGGAAALAVLPTVAVAAPHADAELIALCSQFDTLERRYVDLFDTIDPDKERDALQRPIRDEQDGLLDHIYDLPPSTHQGAVAVARSLALWDAELLKEENDEGWGRDLIVTLVRGLIGEA